jgi:hypothetical protein
MNEPNVHDAGSTLLVCVFAYWAGAWLLLTQAARMVINDTDGSLSPEMTAEAQASSYDALILSHNPAMYLAMSSPGSGRESDLTGRGHLGTYHPAGSPPRTAVLPNGDPVANFNGTTQYLQVPDASDLSVTSRGRLTLEAWIRPDTLQFPSQEGSGYVHFLGKGEANQHEYVAHVDGVQYDGCRQAIESSRSGETRRQDRIGRA